MIAFLLVLGLIIVPTVVSATVSASKKNTTWERAQGLKLTGTPIVQYSVLGSVGDARFFSFTASKPSSLHATIDVPIWSDNKFHPQLIIYQPDTVTMGPNVPVPQPPRTVALIYPSASKDKYFDRKNQISVLERLDATIDIPVDGKYYLAVYNADRAAGRFRITLAEPGEQGIQSIWMWPRQWWIAQTWASESQISAYLPIVLMLSMVGVTWFIVKYRRPHQSHHRKKA